MKIIAAFALSMTLLGTLGGCASIPNPTPGDPLERINRATFEFNDVLDRRVATPIAKGYNRALPEQIRTMVSNFFSNIGDVTVMANNFAQGRGADGVSDLMRIVVNSLFGVGGLYDVATPGGLPKHNQDLGLTLGHWGIPTGPYLVLPVFGPSTFRDAAGLGGDLQLNPTTYLAPAARNSLFGVSFVSTRARYLGATDLLSAAALDKYSFTRDAYLGRRRTLLGGDKEEALPNYESDTAPSGGAKGGGSDTEKAAPPPADGAPGPAPPPADKAPAGAPPAGAPAGR